VKKTTIPIGRPPFLRYTNAHQILRYLRERGACSRADLVRATGLSAPTVTNVVRVLLAEKIVETLGEGESSGGRPPDMLRFRAERGCLLAVEVTARDISFLLTDLNGKEVEARKISLSQRRTTPDAICGYIREETNALLRSQKKARAQLLAMVVGVPAITNVEEGTVLSISTLDDWRAVPLRSMLGRFVDGVVIVENDVNLAAVGERFRGAAQGIDDFVLVHIGTNIGAGIFLGGAIHHGSQWSAGEVAYLRLPSTSRRQPTIHEFGELEAVLTSSGILRSWEEESRREAHRRNRNIDALEVLNLAAAGEGVARRIIRQRAEIVADIVVNLSLILNPGLILLGGEVGSHPLMIDFVRKQLEGGEFAVASLAAAAGDRGVLWGGIALALEVIPGVLLPRPNL
jgi:predicted NBD/HSP70 family sugar kinase